MIFTFDERPSDSPFVERIWRTHSERAGSFSSLAMSHWEMVVTRHNGKTTLTVRGPYPRKRASLKTQDTQVMSRRMVSDTGLEKRV
ncbi:MAG: hypothetical protein ACREBU_06185 [Nitrososphaera sp.]